MRSYHYLNSNSIPQAGRLELFIAKKAVSILKLKKYREDNKSFYNGLEEGKH